MADHGGKDKHLDEDKQLDEDEHLDEHEHFGIIRKLLEKNLKNIYLTIFIF